MYIKRISLFLFSRVYATNVTCQVATKIFLLIVMKTKTF